MDVILFILWSIAAFSLGAWLGPKFVTLWGRKKYVPVVSLSKPQNEFSDYTIEELESHKKYREREYRQTVHYPALRQGHAESLKKVLEMLDWHYTTNGTKDLEEKRARNKAELDDFDRKYAAAMRGN